MRRTITLVGIVAALAFAGCTDDVQKKPENREIKAAEKPGVPEEQATGFVGKVISSTKAGRYVYLEIETEGLEEGKVWVASTPAGVTTGDTVTVLSSMLMVDFYSPTLKRTFEKIYFTGRLMKGDLTTESLPEHPPVGHGTGHGGGFRMPGTNSPHGSMQSPHGPGGIPKVSPHGTGGTPKGSYHNPHGMPEEKQ